MKFMDVGDICHVYKSINFIKRLNRENILFFSISKIMPARPKKHTGTWIVNITIVQSNKTILQEVIVYCNLINTY